MSFTADKQTLDDLNIAGKYKNNSVFSIFNHTVTRRGEQNLEIMFLTPLSDAGAINKRSDIFKYFHHAGLTFPVERKQFDIVEHYLSQTVHPNFIVAGLETCRKKFLNYIGADTEYPLIEQGISSATGFLRQLEHFYTNLAKSKDSSPYKEQIEEMLRILHHTKLNCFLEKKTNDTHTLSKVIRYDHLFRGVCQEEIKKILQILYDLDVYITVAKIAGEKKFCYVKAHPMINGQNTMVITNVYHPQIPGAIANSVRIDHEHNVVFLTGANMAGKSTFMKSFGIAVYLAHMGFPVAAESMEFSVQDGIYTSINVPDNLNMGFSHFYAEVRRVKSVAEEVSQSKNMVIIFDELFKGTNVKDAYDATVAVTEAFAENRNCSFIISTHIIEAGETLRERCSNMNFVYFPTVMKGNVPTYTYHLTEGITNDRHGMLIINNERIIEIIKNNS